MRRKYKIKQSIVLFTLLLVLANIILTKILFNYIEAIDPPVLVGSLFGAIITKLIFKKRKYAELIFILPLISLILVIVSVAVSVLIDKSLSGGLFEFIGWLPLLLIPYLAAIFVLSSIFFFIIERILKKLNV